MRSPIAFLIGLILFACSAALPEALGQGSIAWDKPQLTNFQDEIVATKLDAAGNVVVLGLEYRENLFHIYVAKHAAVDGSILWEVHSETLTSSTCALEVTPDGHVLVACTSGAVPNNPLVVTKFDGQSGAQVWSQNYGQLTSIWAPLLSLAVAQNGSIAVGCTGRENFTDVLFFAALDPATGFALWQRKISINSSNSKALLDLQFDPAGDLIAAGMRDAWTSSGGFSALKLSGATGATLWDVKWAVESGRSDRSAAMAIDANGDVLITGQTSMQPGPTEICTVKFSGIGGSSIWRSVVNATTLGTGSAAHLDVDTGGNAYIIGRITETASSIVRQFTARLNADSGNLEWHRLDVADSSFSSAEGEAAYFDPAGKLVVCGTSSSYFRPYTVRKLSPADGSLIWEKIIPEVPFGHSPSGESGAYRRVSVNARGISVGLRVLGSPAGEIKIVKLIDNLSPNTLAPTEIGHRSATLRATVATTEPGIPQVDWDLGLMWFNLAPIGSSGAPTQNGGLHEYAFAATGLNPGTTYFCRSKATVNGVIAYGPIISFRTVPDAQPIITLLGDSPMFLERGQPYVEPGATAADPEDGPVTVTISGTVDTTKWGSYTITYKATDSTNKITTETRTVSVGDRTPPILSVGGPRFVDAGRPMPSYRDYATADETIVSYSQFPPPGSVAPTGAFEVTLSASDYGGNIASQTFTVTGMAPIANSTLHRRGDAVVAAGAPVGATWKAFGFPCAGNGDRLAFLGTYLAGRKSTKGIFADDGSGLKLIVQLGDAVPDANGASLGDLRFTNFRDPFIDASGNLVAFAARIAGTGITSTNDEGIWRFDSESGTRLVVREGDVASGSDGLPLETGAKIQRIVSAFIPTSETGSSSIFFTARLTGGTPSVVGANNVGIWVSTGDESPRLALREGDTLVTSTGPKTVLTFSTFTGSAGSFGTIRAFSEEGTQVGTRTVLSDGTQQLISIDATGSVTVRLGTGSPVPNTTGLKLGYFGIPASWDSNFTAVGSLQRFVGGSVTGLNDSCIFNAGGIAAREGSQAPGIDGANFKSFRDPVMLSANRSAFRGRVFPAVSSVDEGIWAQDASGGLQLVAREGTRAPDLRKAPFRVFTNIAGASDETGLGLAFTAKLLNGTFRSPIQGSSITIIDEVITPQNDTGLWVTNSTGTLRLVARTGSSFDDPTNPFGTAPIVRNIAFLGSVNGSAGQARGYLSPRSVLYRVTFSDGAQAIVRSLIP